jgi:hypothetical protein
MKYIEQRSGFVLGLSIALALGACSDDSGSGERSAEVSVDPAVAQAALTELTTNVDTTVTGFSGAGPDQAGLAVRCAAGGDAQVDGHVNVVPAPVMVDVNVAIGFNGCTTDSGTTLAGELEFVQSVQAGSVPVRVETVYTGDVVFSGKLQAECAVDLNVLVDEAGRAVQVAGSFCGQDASALNLQVMPRWGS